MFLAITHESFWQKISDKASIQKMLYFPPHLINAPALLPCKNEKTDIVSFHVNVSQVTLELSPNHYFSFIKQ